MSELNAELADAALDACRTNAGEVGAAIGRLLDTEVTAEVGEKAGWSAETPPEGFDGPALAAVLTFGDAGAIAVLPAATGMAPEWAESPDVTGESRLSTFAQELGMLMLPETVMADAFEARIIPNAAEALAAGEPAGDAVCLSVTLLAGEASGVLSLVFPLGAPAAVLGEAAGGEGEAGGEEPAASGADSAPGVGAEAGAAADSEPHLARARRLVSDFADLPVYSRSLLKVPLDVTVCLASKQQSVDEIIHLGPGAIITFEKSCDDPIEVTVGEQTVATGEVVKVGEHFGVRIDAMVLPAERFLGMKPQAG